ncbi:MAG: DUF4143 domain-containing protein [Christensenellaceae bacterium]|jgi:predicted AAA+ superfamily ATPase|nr:DUF4143 domain-containing protein [Christensenellaceae bacterium]
MSIKNKYLPRHADWVLKDMLKTFKAVYITGPKWCGKTTTAERQAKSYLYMQDVNQRENYLKTADVLPSFLLKGSKPRLLDEWQDAPVLWDGVRCLVDQRHTPGHYILTGSVTVKNGLTAHSGTGRITRMCMRTMSLFESKESNGEVSLKSLFKSDQDIESISELTILNLAFSVSRGGWPAAVAEKTKGRALRFAYNYVEDIIKTEISKVDDVQRPPNAVRDLMRSIAHNVSRQVTLSTLCKDLEKGEHLDQSTIQDYLNALSKIFIVEDLRSWNPTTRSKATSSREPIRHFTDPSLAVAILGLNTNGLLKDFITFDFLFKSLCVRDLRIYSSLIDGEVFHYRDENGLEVDAIVQLRDGRWGGVAIKMGSAEIDKGAANLIKLKDTVDLDKLKTPSFLMVLTATKYAYRRNDGVYVVPIGCLRD